MSLTASPRRWTREEEEERHLQLTRTPRHGGMKANNLKMEDKRLNEQSLSGRTAALRPDPLRPNLDSERRVRTGRTATGTFTSGWASSEQVKGWLGVYFKSCQRAFTLMWLIFQQRWDEVLLSWWTWSEKTESGPKASQSSCLLSETDALCFFRDIPPQM